MPIIWYIYDIHVYDIAKLYNVLLVVAILYAAFCN